MPFDKMSNFNRFNQTNIESSSLDYKQIIAFSTILFRFYNKYINSISRFSFSWYNVSFYSSISNLDFDLKKKSNKLKIFF